MSFKPLMPLAVSYYYGPGFPSDGTPFLEGAPAAFWLSRGRHGNGAGQLLPPIFAQLAVDLVNGGPATGWKGFPAQWRQDLAIHAKVYNGATLVGDVSIVDGAPMWAGTPDEHWRWNCTPFPQGTFVPPPSSLTVGPGGVVTNLDVYRPFGAAAAFATGQPCVFYADLPQGRGAYSGGNYFTWTDYVDVSSSLDVRDGCNRAAGLDVIVYGDGDEVRVPSGTAVTRYVVVRVTNMRDSAGNYFKRVFLLRDQPHWPGP